MQSLNLNLYLKNGYLDIDTIISLNYPFTFIIGARGTGKTYGALTYVLNHRLQFLFMRRTQSQADLIGKPGFMPFLSLMRDNPDIKITAAPVTKYNAGFYNAVWDDEKSSWRPVGEPIGYTCALSTVSNLRGFDASGTQVLLYDEFIPERHERPLKNEAQALFNAYETINRNRELNGKDPLKLVALSNANDIASPIFSELNIIRDLEQAVTKRRPVLCDPDRGLLIVIAYDSPISELKSETALYKLTGGTDFAEMAINNDFSLNDFSGIGSRPLSEYVPRVNLGGFIIAKHKSNNNYYMYRGRAKVDFYDPKSKADVKAFKFDYPHLYLAMLDGRITWADYDAKNTFMTIYNVAQ